MSAFSLERRNKPHDEVLNNTAAFVAADSRVNDVGHLVENFDD